MVIPDSASVTIAGMVDTLALKEDGEDLMNIAMRRKVMIGSEFVFTMLMVHGVECDFKKITTTYPKGSDGRDVPTKEFSEGAKKLVG
jgi:hypothetical protein